MGKKVEILVVTHGDLGESLYRSVQMFLPPSSHFTCLSFFEDDNVKELGQKIEELAKHSEQLLILTDMITSTTTRIAAYALRQAHVECISGINLMMLITALREKDAHDVKTLSQLVLTSAREDIVNIRMRIEEDR